LSPLVSAGRHLVTIAILVLILFFANRRGTDSELVSNLVLVAVVLAAGVVSWLVTRWQVAEGVLRIETGLIRRESRRFPLSQIQAIDLAQTGLARVLGLAELRLRMAGADSSGGRLASLPLADAEHLRQRLLVMARARGAAIAGAQARTAPGPPSAAGTDGAAGTDTTGAAGTIGASATGSTAETGSASSTGSTAAATGTEAATAAATAAGWQPGDGRDAERLRSSRLAAAIALSRTGVIAAAVIAVLAAVIAAAGQTGAVASFLPVAIGILLTVWRQFNGDYGTVVVTAADGLRLRSGLVQTTAETIRPGRVQAVRLVEPLAWRALGWCRVEVDVAGPRQRRENRAESRRLRALVPVGSRAEAEQVIGELLTAQPAPSRRAPRRARWKAPLTYHFLGWGGDDRYVVASRGRVCRTTTWVPLQKVQSIRWVQGPVQRRLGLASVRLDVAGRRVTADIEDRASSEADDIFGRLPDLARQARERARAQPA